MMNHEFPPRPQNDTPETHTQEVASEHDDMDLLELAAQKPEMYEQIQTAKKLSGWYGKEAFSMQVWRSQLDTSCRKLIDDKTLERTYALINTEREKLDPLRLDIYVLENFERSIAGPGGVAEQMTLAFTESAARIDQIIKDSGGRQDIRAAVQQEHAKCMAHIRALNEQLTRAFEGSLPDIPTEHMRDVWIRLKPLWVLPKQQFEFMTISRTQYERAYSHALNREEVSTTEN